MFSFRRTLSIILTTLMIGILIMPSVIADEPLILQPIEKAEYEEGSVIVKFNSVIPVWAKANYRAIINTTRSRRLGTDQIELIRFEGKTLDEVIDELRGKPGIEWAETNYMICPPGTYPSDEFWYDLWGMKDGFSDNVSEAYSFRFRTRNR